MQFTLFTSLSFFTLFTSLAVFTLFTSFTMFSLFTHPIPNGLILVHFSYTFYSIYMFCPISLPSPPLYILNILCFLFLLNPFLDQYLKDFHLLHLHFLLPLSNSLQMTLPICSISWIYPHLLHLPCLLFLLLYQH